MTSKRKQIALFGGSFDPPHVAHLQVVKFLLSHKDFDEVWLMPIKRHAFEKPLTPFHHRLAMLKLLVGKKPKKLKIKHTEREWHKTHRKPNRTVETLKFLQKKHPAYAFTLILGSDLASQTKHWKNFPQIQKMATVLYLPRKGFALKKATKIPVVFSAVASTQIRQRLQKNPKHFGGLTPAVARYIRQKNLYSPRQTA